MKWLIAAVLPSVKVLLILTVIVVVWTAFLRPWLRNKPWAQWFFRLPVVEWIEINIYLKSETIAWARWLTALGGLMTAVANTDAATAQMMYQMFEPILPERIKGIATFIPLIISAAGMIAEWQRRDTTKPLAVVAMPSDAPIEVKAKVAEAARVNAEAASAVKEAA